MPLLNGQPVDLVTPTSQQLSAREQQQLPQQQGWRIRFTGEEFADYDQYLDRLSFYRKPIWTCAVSGQSALTYEQAQLSERASRHRKTGIGFSDMLICEMLTFLSQSTMSIALAVDALYYRFQYDFFAGEHIDVKYPDTNGAMYECFVVGIGPLPTEDRIERREETAAQAAARLSIERLGEAASYVIAYEQRKQRIYTVRLYDVDGNPIDDSDISVPASELSRSRNMFTKVAIRQFLDDNMRRDPRPGSPWIVCAQWRERFRIPYMYGGEARLLKSSSLSKASRRIAEAPLPPPSPPPATTTTIASAREPVVVDPYADERDFVVKQYRKIPIDDLEYLQFKHVRYAQGILWALRRKQQKLASGDGKAAALAKGGTHQITEYFPATTKAPRRSSDGNDAVCVDDDDNGKGKKDEEAEEDDDEEEEEEEDLRNKWPVPLCSWQVPLPLVSRMLSAYMFISCFSAPLALNPYPLDYFESALVHDLPAAKQDSKEAEAEAEEAKAVDSGARVCSVYRETVVALLNSLIDDRRRNQAPANVSARIEAMVSYQDANLSEAPASATDDDMDVDDRPAAEEPKPKTKKKKTPRQAAAAAAGQQLPPVAPAALGARSAKTRASRTIARQAGASSESGGGRGRPTRASGRLQRASLLSTSSSIGSASDSSTSSSSELSEPELIHVGRKGGRRVVASEEEDGEEAEAEESGASSRAASPAMSESDGPLVSDMAGLAVERRPHELLRRLSRTWANAAIGGRTHWAGALAGWLMEAQHDYAAELAPIAAALWAAPSLTLATLEAQLWHGVLACAERRLAVLELLVCECANNERIRAFLDECTDQAAELKRERLECRRELKRVAEAMADLDHHNEGGDGPLADAFSRDQSRREKEVEAQKQKQRRKLGESERTHMRRLDYVGRELRRLNVGRLTPLGTDRFFNKYFFIDGVAGCPSTGAGAGRILVQPASRDEQAEALDMQPHFVANSWALSMPAAWTGGLPLRGAAEAQTLAPFIDNTDSEELAPLARAGELWGYYATTSQVDKLKRWLDPRGGKREAALAAELDLLQVAISASLRKRCQQLEQFYAARAKARDQIRAQMTTQAMDNSASSEDTMQKLQKELARIDTEPLPASLLPPHILVDRQQQSPAAANGANTLAAAAAAPPGSSRASSAEPTSSSVSGTAVVVKPARGRKPKIPRVERVKTYIDEFLEYENTTTSTTKSTT